MAHAPAPGNETGEELVVLRGHQHGVTVVAYCPDGRRIARGSYDKTVRIWDAEAGVELVVLCGHEGRVSSLAYSPDGRRIASGSDDKTIRVWDVETGEELAVLCGHKDSVESIAYSPDGRRIASAGGLYDETVRVWNVETGECIEVIHGRGDVSALAAGPARYPLRALAGGLEMVVEFGSPPRAAAHFPATVDELSAHPNGHTWVGANWNHLYILTLEGEVPQ